MHRLVGRAGAAVELQRVAPHEIARRIGLVELLAPQRGDRAAAAIELLVDIARDDRPGMQHQVLADQAGGVGEPVGKPRRRRVQQQARRADAVAGQDHDLGRLELLAPVGVVVDRAGRHAVLVGGDLAHPAARAQLDAGADRERPVGDVGAGLGALRAARRAVTEVDAARPALVVGRGDAGVGRPPVPAELVHRLGVARAGLAERDRRHRRMARRHAGVSGQAGAAHHAVVLLVEPLERPVVDRPVVGDAVERLHLEVRRVQARPVRRVDHRAAADAVEVGDLHDRVVVVDRIVGVAPALVRADGEIGVAPGFPVAAVAREVGRLHPVALLQAEDAHPACRPGSRPPRRPRRRSR